MELRHLRYFLAVAEHGTFTGAATALNVTQPALSRQVQDLELEMRAALFDRSPKGVRLTPAGEALRVHARAIVAEVQAAQRNVARAVRGQRGALRIGLNIVAMHLPRVSETLRAQRSANPEVELRVAVMTSQEQLDLFRTDELDVGFLNMVPGQRPDLSFREIASYTLGVALPRAHPLAGRDDLLLADLVERGFVWPARHQSISEYDRLLAACLNRGFVPEIVQESSGVDALISMVNAGIGMAFIPSCLAGRLGPGIVMKSVRDFADSWPLYLVWRKDDDTPITTNFVTLSDQSDEAP